MNYWTSAGWVSEWETGWYDWKLNKYDKQEIKDIINIYTKSDNDNESYDNGQLFIESLDNTRCSIYFDYITYLKYDDVSRLINEAISIYKKRNGTYSCTKCFDLQYIIEFKILNDTVCNVQYCIVNSRKINCPLCNYDLILR